MGRTDHVTSVESAKINWHFPYLPAVFISVQGPEEQVPESSSAFTVTDGATCYNKPYSVSISVLR